MADHLTREEIARLMAGALARFVEARALSESPPACLELSRVAALSVEPEGAGQGEVA